MPARQVRPADRPSRAPYASIATMSAGLLAVDVSLPAAKPWRPATLESAVQAAISVRQWRPLGRGREYSPAIGSYRRLADGEPAPVAPRNVVRVRRDRTGARWGWVGVVAPPAVRRIGECPPC